ncbi:ferrochelatase [Povalibacter sp.]|uniref:ferrochelatase n=1 Tax=Povalibacter sp. TaxID=1962978 RepID=UPI002F3EDE0A
MPDYLGQPHYEHGSPSRLGVLLVNLGTPDAPSPGAVRRFLAEFLWDPRVVEAPRWLWWLALHGVILRIRPRRSAHAYQQIWTTQGSPLLVHGNELAQRLQSDLSARLNANVVVALGMTYGSPSIRTALEKLHHEGVRRLIVLPLYPQYSGTTTASVFDRVARTLSRFRWLPSLRFITEYHDDPRHIRALADSVTQHWQTYGQNHLLFSFHGIPRSYLLAGDPYHCQSLKTARLVSESLGLKPDEWSVAFQSQVGRAEWLRPYTDELLTQYARGSHKRVSVICPGFATDCLETLEEIAIRNRALFLENGGESYDYIPALNATDDQVAALSELVVRNAAGWQAEGVAEPMSRERALQAGASR